ncbi:MAG TPA: MogA/MoaB family molybdenum cofactor biosynthesis protein [Planctomycetota bacterium]|nr:MogA/MoaB family molybdenum cofactor biosynthesis protein [Planctomycetota bacterium]
MGARDHREQADQESARVAILTVSDTRTPETDTSGKEAFEIFRKFGHTVVEHAQVPNERKKISEAAEKALREADLVVTIGGTGASRKDVTVEALRPLVEKELPGFGELFRSMSAREIGTAAILSRALLGVTSAGRIVVALPGSTGAVRLGLEGILMNELKHLLWELRRYA